MEVNARRVQRARHARDEGRTRDPHNALVSSLHQFALDEHTCHICYTDYGNYNRAIAVRVCKPQNSSIGMLFT